MALSKTISAALLAATCLGAALPADAAGFAIKNLVANKQIYQPDIVDAHMKNGWGVAIRPKGAGGHFWINNTDDGTVSLYVGDVGTTKLHQDMTTTVTIAAPKGSKEASHPTGIVFNGRDDEFIVSHDNITGPSKFIFTSEDGTVVGWTEKKNDDGSFVRPEHSVVMVDNSKKGAIYKGITLSEGLKENRLYLADFANHRIDVYDAQFKPVKLAKDAFANKDVPKDYAPFNVQSLNGALYVTYAKLTKVKGEEEKGVGNGYVAAFDYDGKFLRCFEGKGRLNAPWGLAIAPTGFGEHGGQLLVGNFGDGRIVAFDATTGKQVDYIKRADATPVEVDGLWGLVFGNGESLGEANQLYYAAGPADEADGVFGKIIPQ